MKLNRILSALAATALLSTVVPAGASPPMVPVQGYLTDLDGLPIDGTTTALFAIYAAPTGGAPLYTTTQNLTVEDGRFVVYLGETGAPLDLSLFEENVDLFLGVTVAGEPEMLPRTRLGTTPYSGFSEFAGNAALLEGSPASDFQRRITGTCPPGSAIASISATGTVTCEVAGASEGDITAVNAGVGLTGGATTGAATLSVDFGATQRRVVGTCAGGVLVGINADGTVVCEDDDGELYTAGLGIAISGLGTISVDPDIFQRRVEVECAAGSAIRAISATGSVICQSDDNTTYTGGAGVVISGANAVSVDDTYVQRRVQSGAGAGNTLPCPFGIANVAQDGSVTCAANPDTNSVYTAGQGLALTGNSFSIPSSGCSPGNVLGWDGAGWACAPVVDTNTTYTAGAGLSLTGTTFAISSSGCAAGQILGWNGSGWACVTDQGGTTYTAGPGLALTGTSFGLAPVGGCAANQFLRFNGTDWVCAVPADTNTTYTAGTGLVLSGTTFAIGSAGCSAGQVLQWNGSAWGCAADANTTYTAGNGLALTGTTFSLSGAGCANGQVLKWNGTAFTCQNDNNTATTYTAGSGLSLTGTTFSLQSGCTAGQVLKWNGTAWACSADTDTNTTYSAGVGLSLSGTTFSINGGACAAGQVLAWNGTTWACANDNAGASYTAGTGLALTGTQFRVQNCVTNGHVLKWNSGTSTWGCGADTDTTYDIAAGGGLVRPTTTTFSLLRTCSAGQSLKWNGTAWACANDDNTTYTAGSGIAVVGTTISLTSACTANQVLRYNGTAWACAADANTTYTAGTGLLLTGTTFSLPTGCANGQLLKWNSGTSTWGCAADTDTNTTYTGGGGVVLTGTVFSLPVCANGQVLKHNGTTWACAADATGSAYTAQVGGGIEVNSTQLSLLRSCASGQTLKWNGTAWACAADIDTNTTYTASTGLVLSGTAFSLNSAGCPANGVWRWNGTAWACAADLNTTYSAQAGGGLALTGTELTMLRSCLNGQVLKWNGTAWACANDNDTISATTYTAGNGLSLTGTTFSYTTNANTWIERTYRQNVALALAATSDTSRTITVPAGVGILEELEVFVQLEHSFIGDVIIYLTGPNGVTIVLYNRHGGSGFHLYGSFVDEYGPFPTQLSAPYIRGMIPIAGLNALRNNWYGASASGNWTLRIQDTISGDGGTWRSWGLRIKTRA